MPDREGRPRLWFLPCAVADFIASGPCAGVAQGDLVRIRRARPSDVARLAELRYTMRTALAPSRQGKAAFQRRCRRWMAQRLKRRGSWAAWVAHAGGTIVGGVWIELFEKMPNPVGERERHAYLTNLFVEPRHRSQGLGARLVRTAVAWADRRGVDAVILWPSPKSRPLYARLGFRGHDAILQVRHSS